MNKLQKRIASAVATAALLLNTALPVLADVTIEISGNGTETTNDAEVEIEQGTFVTQVNEAFISNVVLAEADTGDNEADDNTGGDVEIETGDAEVAVDIENSVNTNAAEVGCCGAGDVDVLISENGSDSDNDVSLGLGDTTLVEQANFALMFNMVDAEAETGDNEAEDNTGGEVEIKTGDALVKVSLDNMANFNYADVDCGCLLDVTAKIAGNGEDSDNDISAKLGSVLGAAQGNFWTSDGVPCFDNHCGDDFVDAEAETGDNEVNDSTGKVDGDPSIETGDAEVDVELENSGNVNVYGDVPSLELPGGVSLNISIDLGDLLAWLGLS